MPLIVTLDMFSGLANPKFAISDKDAQRIESLVRSAGLAERARPAPRRLGYRGFVVERAGIGRGPEPLATIRAGDHVETERLLVGYARERLADRVSQTAWGHVSDQLDRFEREGPQDREERREPGWVERIEEKIEEKIDEWREPKGAPEDECPPCVAADAPAYNPGPWNTEPTLSNNNCYNYANNQATNTFAQPGQAHGFGVSVTACSGVEPGAVLDGLTAATSFTAPLGLGQGWYVALVLAPNYDYHWYRQDTVGCWSHKPGGTPATNVDNSGNPITDPQTADRGPYTVFCTYMVAYTTDVII